MRKKEKKKKQLSKQMHDTRDTGSIRLAIAASLQPNNKAQPPCVSQNIPCSSYWVMHGVSIFFLSLLITCMQTV